MDVDGPVEVLQAPTIQLEPGSPAPTRVVTGDLSGNTVRQADGFRRLAEREPRMGRNPATGARVEIPAKQVVKARIAKPLKDVVEA